jgi:hypothetical protein
MCYIVNLEEVNIFLRQEPLPFPPARLYTVHRYLQINNLLNIIQIYKQFSLALNLDLNKKIFEKTKKQIP